MCSLILEVSNSDRILYDTENERLFYKPKAYLVAEVAVNWQFLHSAPTLTESDFVVQA